MTSSNPHHLPKAPPPNTIPLGVRASTYEFEGGHEHLVPHDMSKYMHVYMCVHMSAPIWATELQVVFSFSFCLSESPKLYRDQVLLLKLQNKNR